MSPYPLTLALNPGSETRPDCDVTAVKVASALHCTRGVQITLQTAVHVVRPRGYAVMTKEARRCTDLTLSALLRLHLCLQHNLTLSLPCSLNNAAPPQPWLTQVGLVLPACCHLVAPLR